MCLCVCFDNLIFFPMKGCFTCVCVIVSFFIQNKSNKKKQQTNKHEKESSYRCCNGRQKEKRTLPRASADFSEFVWVASSLILKSLRPGSGILTRFPFDRTVKCVIESLCSNTHKLISQSTHTHFKTKRSPLITFVSHDWSEPNTRETETTKGKRDTSQPLKRGSPIS